MWEVEKESQKAINIGKEGSCTIKKLGETSRKSIEEFLQREVFLELRVKSKAQNGRKDENMLNILVTARKNKI
ncbi:MAG: KH domain-containing protein [Ignavibacteriales bacterium]|nr:KH domain-containing protein [Ignavibacteriales bacterium]